MPQIVSRARQIRTLSGLRLEPGANDVDSDVWARASASEYAQGLIKRGLLVVRADPPPPTVDEVAPDAPPPESLAGLSAKAAIEIVGASTSVAQVKAWLDTDGRMTVRKAILARIYALEPAPRDEDEAKERSDTSLPGPSWR